MFAWNAASREWYLRAALACNYHHALARALSPWLAPSDSVLEAGCGLGLLALETASLVHDVTAVDTDAACLALGLEQCRARSIDTVRFLQADVFDLRDDAAADVVLACLFGDPVADHARLQGLARRHVLWLTDTGRPGTSLVPGHLRRAKRPADMTAALLNRAGVAHTRQDLVLDFGQPLNDREEARAFVRHYSAREASDAELDAHLDRLLVPFPGGGLFLPHMKRLSLFVLPGRSDS